MSMSMHVVAIKPPDERWLGRWLGICEAEVVSIGCEQHSLADWEAALPRIAEEPDATPYEIALARMFLSACADVQRLPGYGRKP
jgi:hypothetical protein